MNAWTTYLPALEDEMRRLVVSDGTMTPLLYGMLQYHLGWVDEAFQPTTVNAGKRIRPLLLLLATEAQGGDWLQALPAAAAVELLHNFTLIHDDIEDGDDLRRGRATLWKLWGVPQAINAGDALFAISYRGIIRLAERNLPIQRTVTALERYTEAVIAITEGQSLDIAFESQAAPDETAYLTMISGKTAALLGMAAELGGVIAGAPPARTSALRAFGEALGMAFQMYDDLLGLWGDPQRTGKPVGADLRRGKKTLPILHAIGSGDTLSAMNVRDDLTDGEVVQLLQELERLGCRVYTEQQAVKYHVQALEALERSGGTGPAQEALRDLTASLLKRDR